MQHCKNSACFSYLAIFFSGCIQGHERRAGLDCVIREVIYVETGTVTEISEKNAVASGLVHHFRFPDDNTVVFNGSQRYTAERKKIEASLW